MEPDRLNSPSTFSMNLEVLGHELQFSQEKNCRKGRFCPSKLKGKRVLELGAGCGVAGFGMALLGCDVVATDQIEVLPLLMRNVERNTSRILQMNPGSDSFGSIQVAELDWGNKDHIRAVDPPFDYIIGTDVVYAEHLLEPLLQTIFALSGPKTTILLGYEIRSTSVHEQMLQMWRRNFDVKIIPQSKMDQIFQHPSIQLFIMGAKRSEEIRENIEGSDHKIEKVKTSKEEEESGEQSTEEKVSNSTGDVDKEDCKPVTNFQNEKLNDFEVRRTGSMAARLLRDVKIA